MSAHYEEELELFALGDLEPAERAAIEAHVKDCVECTRRLGEAEEALARMSSLLPAYRAPGRAQTVWRPGTRVAVASAFIAGLIAAALTFAFVNLNGTSNTDVRAQIAMINSHFTHVQLEAAAPGAPAAKVIFPPNHAWLYAIVDDGRPGYRLLLVSPAGPPRDLGGLIAHGASSSLFVERAPPGYEVELARNGEIVARGRLP